MNPIVKMSKKVYTINFRGRLDASSCIALKTKIREMLKNNKKYMVLNMKEIQFMDSSGLGALVACYRMAHNEGGDIKLCSLKDPILALVELTRLNRIFEIYDNPEDAKDSYL